MVCFDGFSDNTTVLLGFRNSEYNTTLTILPHSVLRVLLN